MATNHGAGLTPSLLQTLLSRFHEDPAQAAETFTRLRMRLEVYFAGNDCRWPDELADRALDVLAEKIAGGEPVESPTGYAFGIARHLLMEERRKQLRAPIPLDETHGAALVATEETETEPAPSARIECLKLCLGEVPGGELFLEYHRGDPTEHSARRHALAQRERLSPGGLRNRVHKLRRSLEQCVDRCQGAREKGTGQ